MILFFAGLGVGIVIGVILVFLWALGRAAKMEDEWIRDYGA